MTARPSPRRFDEEPKFIGRRLAKLAVVGGISAALLLAAHPAQAVTSTRPLAEAITVDGASHCLEASSVGAQVARWLRSDAIDARVSIVVSAADEPSPALSFEVRREGQVIAVRRFDPPPVGCADIRRVVAIAIALAIESTVLEARSSEPPRQRRPFVLRPSWGVSGAVLAGVLPELAFGLESHVDVDLSTRFALTAGTLTTFPSDAPVGSGRADLRLIAVQAGACWIALRGLVAVRACGGVAAGGVRVAGEAFAPSYSPFLPWVSVMGHVGTRLALWSWLAIEGGVDGFLPVLRPNLEVASSNGAIVLSRSFPVGGAMGALGLAATFQ